MSNCKTGDIAIVTWDEAPVFQNVGNLVRVGARNGCNPMYGLTWLIEPLDYGQIHLFIDGRDGDKVKRQEPGDNDINHPDAWLRPLCSPDDLSEEVIQKILELADDGGLAYESIPN